MTRGSGPMHSRAGRGAGKLARSEPVPLWAQLLDDLERRLGDGEFGSDFPTELRLAEEYGVSRHTVREALRRVRASGAVVAERGRGSHVVTPRLSQHMGAIYSLFQSVEAQGLEQRSVVRELDIRQDAAAASVLRLPASADLVYLERLRLAGGEPLALDCLYLPATIARPLLKVDFGHTALYEELARRCGTRVDSGHEDVQAIVPTPEHRALLGMRRRTAAFCIERTGHSGGRPVETRHTLIRGDRFTLSADFARGSSYRLYGGHPAPPRARGQRK